MAFEIQPDQEALPRTSCARGADCFKGEEGRVFEQDYVSMDVSVDDGMILSFWVHYYVLLTLYRRAIYAP